MGCCGRGKRIVSKGKNIIKGYATEIIGIKYEFAAGRRRKCRKCDYCTWLTRGEYAKWLFSNGIEVLTNFDDLTALPMLPKKEGGNILYCMICKCEIPPKTNIKEEECPKNNWIKILD
jgi:hypothetical protein